MGARSRKEKEKGKEREKEKEPAKNGTSSSKRAGVGGRRRTHGRGAGLLQLRSLASYLFLQSSSARPSRPHHARRSNLRQQTLYRAPCRLPTLTRPPPRVADMVDGAEERAESVTEK